MTGSSSGLGFSTALELCRAGAEVYVAARSEQRGERAVAQIVADTGGCNAKFIRLDLGSLAAVNSTVSAFLGLKKPLHILVCNAGVMHSPGIPIGGIPSLKYEASDLPRLLLRQQGLLNSLSCHPSSQRYN